MKNYVFGETEIIYEKMIFDLLKSEMPILSKCIPVLEQLLYNQYNFEPFIQF